MLTVEERNAIDYAVQLIRNQASDNISFTSAEIARSFLILELAQREAECFAVAYLDSQYKLLEFKIMFEGTINQTAVFPREIAKHALKVNAAAVVLSHNHPSGLAKPSTGDRDITEVINDALHMLGIRTLDHIIVGSTGGVYSFAEHGLL